MDLRAGSNKANNYARGFLVCLVCLSLLSVSRSWATRPLNSRRWSPHSTELICRLRSKAFFPDASRIPITLLSVTESVDAVTDAPFTSAILKISYDGTRFTGWSAANDPTPGTPEAKQLMGPRRNRRKRGSSAALPPIKGYVRSVQGLLRLHLAKLYGNLDAQQIVVEGSSRTDKGVHARGMMAMVYGLKSNQQSTDEEEEEGSSNPNNSIPGKSLPHPQNSTDSSSFLPVPMDLSKLAFTLNRMLPPDIRVVGIAPPPSTKLFHPSISALTKTYVYKYVVSGSRQLDPIYRRSAWNVPSSSGEIDLDRVQHSCYLLQGTHNFSSFQGAPRGASDKEKRQRETGICTLQSIVVKELPHDHALQSMPAATVYAVEVTGDRFLCEQA